MNILPIEMNGEKIHAGFWRRFGAVLIDFVVLSPLTALFMYLDTLHRTSSFFTVIPSTLFFWWYQVYFHARWGATLGKMATGVKVTRLDGSPIGYRESLARFSVDAGFAVGMLIAQHTALARMTNAQFDTLSWYARALHLATLMPVWAKPMMYLNEVWFWGEFIVLLSNKRRRALHDFIAGTVVIKKQYARRNN